MTAPKQTDVIATVGRSQIQHGPLNDRIYLMHLHRQDHPRIVRDLQELADAQGYSKVFAKVPVWAAAEFLEAGYQVEARVPGFYDAPAGRVEGLFLGRFLDPRRAEPSDADQMDAVLSAARAKAGEGERSGPTGLPADMELVECTPDDCPQMAEVYADVFRSYPFPIHDPEYLRETMASHVRYFAVRKSGRLIALSSAEQHPEAGNVEMTDFATLPAARGVGAASALLERMERSLAGSGLLPYTIARAVSFGMNIVFAKAGYRYAGTLVNNTNIAGRFESMNIWYKPLS